MRAASRGTQVISTVSPSSTCVTGIAFLQDDAGRFVPEQCGPRARTMHLVQLRVADAGGELAHHHLRRSGIGEVDFVNLQRSLPARQNHDARGCTQLGFL